MIDRISTKFNIILDSRFKNIEIACINPKYAYDYANKVLKRQFLLGESTIAQSATYSYLYARDIINGPFLLGEESISKSAYCSYWYAVNVLKAPFPLGELSISKSDLYKEKYEQFLNRFLILNKFLISF